MDSTTTTTPKKDENVVDPNQMKIEKMKSLLEKVNWDIEKERYELFDQLHSIIEGWTGQYPNLRDIFPGPQEIEYVLCDSVKRYESSRAKVERFIDFVISTGYKDKPNVDADGKPESSRTTSVHFAASSTEIIANSLVKKLFTIYDNCDANYIGVTGFTHFHIACKFNCLDVVKKFLEHDKLDLRVDPNLCLTQKSCSPTDLRCADEGMGPLHLALVSQYCSEELVELLLTNKADPNLADPKGATPLHDPCGKLCFKELRWLFKFSEINKLTVNVDARDKWGRTPLHMALYQPRKELIELLLRNGAIRMWPTRMDRLLCTLFATKWRITISRGNFSRSATTSERRYGSTPWTRRAGHRCNWPRRISCRIPSKYCWITAPIGLNSFSSTRVRNRCLRNPN